MSPTYYIPMTTPQLKSAIDQALNKMAQVDLDSRRREAVAIYADGSISPPLQPATWEAGKTVVCQVGAWWSASHSKTRNAANRRAEKMASLERAEFTIAERAAV